MLFYTFYPDYKVGVYFVFENKTMIFMVVSIVIVASSFLMLAFSYSYPVVEERTVTLCNYIAKSNYDYMAYLRPNIVYDNASTLSTGEDVLFLKLVKRVDINYTFDFIVDKPAVTVVTSTFELKLISPKKWEKSLLLTSGGEMEGENIASINSSFTLNFGDIFRIIELIEDETGTRSSVYDLLLIAKVNVMSSTDYGLISLPINHTVRMTLRNSMGGGQLIEITNLSYKKPGSITKREVIINEDVRFRLYVSYALLGIGLVFLTPSAYFFLTNRKKDGGRSIESIIKPLDEYLIEVKELPFKNKDVLSVKVKSIDDLAKIAEGLGKPVLLRRVNDKSAILCLVDGNVLYEYVVGLKE